MKCCFSKGGTTRTINVFANSGLIVLGHFPLSGLIVTVIFVWEQQATEDDLREIPLTLEEIIPRYTALVIRQL